MKWGSYALLVAFGLAAASCSGGERGGVVGQSARLCKPGSVETLRSEHIAYAGVVRWSARAYRRPGRGLIHTFGRENVNNHVTVLGVLSAIRDRKCEATWYRVQLPLKPNGTLGYVRGSELELMPVRTRILIDISDRKIVLERAGRVVLETVAAVGSEATPTPTGRYYVNQRLRAADPSGPYGPGGVGISAFSEVLTYWAQGGPIAIHGTNRPETIGLAASNGCLRVRNDVLRQIFDAALPGTPVVIRA
ncbi:MAG: L,D-transpeptidase [Gaiellaceae bacterium]